MSCVASYYQELLKEDSLGLFWRYLVALPVLGRIRLIPIEADTFAKRVTRRHSLYISHIYQEREEIRCRNRTFTALVLRRSLVKSRSVFAKDAVVLDAFDAGGTGAGYGFLVDHFVL